MRTASEPAFAEQKPSIYLERDRIDRLGRIRQLVFGSLDGLLVPLGVISGVAGGTGNSKAVIIAGLAEAFAGALSMGAGEFISARSEAQVHQAEVLKEMEEMRQAPLLELREMAQLLHHEGVAVEDADTIALMLSRYPRAYAKTMVEKELGVKIEPQTVRIPEALTMSGSYILASIFPLIAYFFLPVQQALPASFLLTLIALGTVGIVKGKLATLSLFKSVIEVLAVGVVSAGGGYLLGVLVPHLLGF